MPVKDKERKEPYGVNLPLLPKKTISPQDVDILLTKEPGQAKRILAMDVASASVPSR